MYTYILGGGGEIWPGGMGLHGPWLVSSEGYLSVFDSFIRQTHYIFSELYSLRCDDYPPSPARKTRIRMGVRERLLDLMGLSYEKTIVASREVQCKEKLFSLG